MNVDVGILRKKEKQQSFFWVSLISCEWVVRFLGFKKLGTRFIE